MSIAFYAESIYCFGFKIYFYSNKKVLTPVFQGGSPLEIIRFEILKLSLYAEQFLNTLQRKIYIQRRRYFTRDLVTWET